MAKKIFDHLKETIFRDDILNHRRRPDGARFRKFGDQLRSRLVPRTHGSACLRAARRRRWYHDARHERRRAVHGRSGKGRSEAALHAELQLPAVLVGETGASAVRPPRNRPRRARASRARSERCRTTLIPIHDSHRV
jgi:polyribonucleotide nucleotidyltransferase